MTGNGAAPFVLQADRVWFSYRNHDSVLKDVSLAIPAGKHTVIMGPSGTGKTTLLRVLAGILKPNTGRVSIFGQPTHELSRRQLSSLIGYIPQQLGLVRNSSALDNVLMGSLGRIGDGKFCRRWRGRARPERHPARLVVHPQEAREHQQ